MKIRFRPLNLLIAWCSYFTLKLVFLTVRVRIFHAAEGTTTYEQATGKTRYCFCLWHEDIINCILGRRSYQLAGLISQHQDGGYLADAARLAGIVPIRGSATRGGSGAVRQLLERPELHIAITPDGPLGPRHRLKDGILYLSSRSDRPIVCCGLDVSRCWRIPGRWTDLVIPKPFSRLVIVTGPPLVLPEEIDRAEFPSLREMLEDEMDRLSLIAKRIQRGNTAAAEALPDAVWCGEEGTTERPELWTEPDERAA